VADRKASALAADALPVFFVSGHFKRTNLTCSGIPFRQPFGHSGWQIHACKEAKRVGTGLEGGPGRTRGSAPVTADFAGARQKTLKMAAAAG
jgi:hypothetical protein